MNIRGYLQTSLNEWPSKVTAVIWLADCNFRCPYCQNKDLVLQPKKLPKFVEKEIFTDLKKRKSWLDAVVITGGEPTLQTDLADFLQKIKRIPLLTMIETNGSQPEVLKKLFQRKLLDRTTMDIKTLLDRESYRQASGVEIKIETIKESINLILNSGTDFEFRTTVVPTVHTQENLVRLAKQLVSLTAGQSVNWILQQFVPQNCLDPAFEKIKPFSKKKMRAILSAVQKHFPGAKLRSV